MTVSTDGTTAGVPLDLSWLLSPITPAVFAAEHFERQPLRVSRSNAGYYSCLLSESALEIALATATTVPGAIEALAEENKPLQCHRHEQAIAAFDRGNSLRINAIQRFCPPIKDLSMHLEEELNYPINVNMYLTPDSGKKALDRHYDTHDVFVVQIHGTKRWRVFSDPVSLPLEYIPPLRFEATSGGKVPRSHMDMAGKNSCLLTDELLLKAGDVLYLPRGYWHEAETPSGEVSCHLTIGVEAVTYLDVICKALSQAALSDIRFRQSLPPGYASMASQRAAAFAQMAVLLEQLPQSADVDAALKMVEGQFIRRLGPGLANGLLKPRRNDALSEDREADTSVVLRLSVDCRLEYDRSPARVTFGGQAFEITAGYQDACRFISEATRFTVSELPGDLSDPQKFALVNQLLAENVVERLAPDNEPTALETRCRRWIPTAINTSLKRVDWLELGNEALSDPFFHQTIDRYQKEHPNAKTRSTPLQSLKSVTSDIAPSGFIFHISRCGSTLLANALRALPEVIVVSEPETLGQLLWLSRAAALNQLPSAEIPEDLDQCLVGLVNAFGKRRVSKEKTLVIKFSSWNIAFLSIVRRVWPKVPVVIVVRNPAEVVVSCLENPPDGCVKKTEIGFRVCWHMRILG